MSVTFSTLVHVVPEVTNTWVATVSCPCYNIEPFFTVNLTFPSAAHPPWNLTVEIAYEANITGSTYLSDIFVAPRVETFGTFDGASPGGASGAPKELKLGYLLQPTRGGNYTLHVKLSNEVSNSSLNPVQIQVMEGIRDVRGVVTWVMNGIELPGTGPAKDIYVANLTTLVTPSTLTGTPLQWRLYILPTKQEQIVDYVPGYKFNLTYPAVGPVTFIVGAYNTKQGWVTGPPINVTFVDKIAGFSLSDDGALGSVNVSKPVISNFEILTPISCLMINWGDNSTEETYGDQATCWMGFPELPFRGTITSNQILNHTYMQEGIFTVSGLAYDLSLNALTSQLVVVVADIPCKMPNVSIADSVKQVYNAPTQIKSLPIRVQSNTIIECNRTVTVKRYWTVTMVNGTTGQALAEKPIEGIVSSWNYTTLILDALFLDIGFYKFTYTVDIQASKIVSLVRSDFTYYQVIRSNLSASILPGGITSTSRAFMQSLDLKPGTESVDPDEPGVPFTNVKWYCRQVLPSAEKLQVDANNFPLPVNTQPIPDPKTAVGKTGGGCFGVGPGMLSYNGSMLSFQVSSFYLADATFEFTVVVQKDERRAAATLEIKVVAQPPPEVAIRCSVPSLCLMQSDGQLVNPAVPLTLVGNCTNYCTTTRYYSWEVKKQNGDYIVIDQPNCDSTKTSCLQSFDSGTDGVTVSISPSMFVLNPLSEQFTVRLTIITSDNRIGFSQISIKKNKPPIGGNCTISSDNGYYCLMSKFMISCDKWQDPEGIGIAAYNFYYLEHTIEGKTVKAAMASTQQISLSAVLPYGNFSLYVEVSDSFGAFTLCFVSNVSTIMPTKEMVNAYNTSGILASLSTAGDSIQLTMFIKALNSLTANANWSDISDNSFNQKNLEEQQAILAELSDSKSRQLQSLKNSAPPSSIAEVNVFSDVLDSVVSVVLGSQAGSMTVGLDAREDCLTSLEKTAHSLPGITVRSASEYEQFVKSSLNVMTALMKGMNAILETQVLLPPKDIQAAADGALDYDGAVPDDPNMAIPDNVHDIYKQSIMESTKRQSISQLKRMNAVVETINTQVLSKLVTGQTFTTRSASGTSINIAKIGEETLKKGRTILSPIDQNSSVILPENFCPSSFINEYSDCLEEFGLMFLTWPVITHFHPETRTLLARYSSIIELVVTSNDLRVNVTNATKLINVVIPRDSDIYLNPLMVNVSENINKAVPLVFHYFNITAPQAGYMIAIQPSSTAERLVLLVAHEMFPVPGKFLFSGLVGELPFIADYRTLFIDSDTNNNRTGRFVAGIGKLLNNAHPSNFTRKDLDEKFATNYRFKITIVGCYFYDETQTQWSAMGLKVLAANATHTKCGTNHLSQFGSGFLPTVNEVNFDFLTANMGFIDNSTLYITLILLFVLFIIAMIWGHYKDKKDVERRGVIALPDNKPEDKYIYEVTFVTGPDSDAPCESQIYFIASGDYDETEVRFLPKANPNLYRRYDRNTFVMTTSRPLGPLHYLRVFLDNRGRLPYDSWQLERVVFRDLQKFEQYTFETNAWLALNRGDGLVDRTFLCANYNEDVSTFSQKMYVNVNRNANQDHIWMSVFLRPIGSRYCRKERIVVCATFLFVSMLLNAMFYEVEGESPIDAYAFVGPVPISLSQMFKGMIAIMLLLPFTSLLGAVFKRARPRKNIRCQALDAIEKQRKKQYIAKGLPEEDATEKSKVSEKNEEEPKPKVKPALKCLPWWTRPLGWVACAVAMAGSVFIVWSYGITWGEITTVKWFSSFFTTFLVSILVSQWLKVAFASCLGSICCSPNHSVEDIDCDEKLPQLKEDETWAFMSPLDPSTVRKVHRVIGATHDVDKTNKLSVKLTKNRDMKFIVRGIIIYCVFLAVLFIIVNDKTDYNAFLLQDNFKTVFIDRPYFSRGRLYELRNTDQFWRYAKSTIMSLTRAQRWYNGKTPYGLRGFLDDRANRMVGYPILRQIRNSRFVCSVPYPMNETIEECTGMRNLLLEDDQDYCASWVLDDPSSASCKYPEFRYQTASELKTFTTVGRLGTYGAGGYVIRLNGNQDDVIARLDQLQKVQWIDKRSRAVFLEFSVYNANVNLFMTCVILFEINEGGGMITKWRFEPVRLLRLESSLSDNLVRFCELLFVGSTVFFTLRQLWEIKKQRCGYFFKYWNIAELLLVSFSWVEIALYIYKMLLTLEIADEFNQTKGNAYLRMDQPVLVDQYYTCILGIIMFISLLKLIKLMQFNKRMDVLALTISLCWDELSYFLIAFVIIFFAFSCLFFFIFFLNLPEFSSILSAVQTSFSMMLGKFDFDQMQQANSLSPLLFFVFSVMNSMILVNIMLVIILKAFNEVKVDLSKRENPYEVMDYMWDTFKKTLVLQPNEINQVHVNLNMRDHVVKYAGGDGDLSDKLGQLLQHVNNVYFDGKLDVSNSRAMKAALGADAQKRRMPVFQHDAKPRTIFFSD
ncbi:uncharacterized protein LOC108665866 [Hyalella azteca]|uniref:Uncharacterized protein LOC108665866 n=1 Tax=Hyalella azteca TaxID=294128 RepID=A0A8B7N4H3_HYAAZ|nr:uncharacterized protein LOC108665866 [Hyalella azteca]